MEDRKVQILFDSRALEIIDQLKDSTGRKSVADVVRDALMLYDWARRMTESGYTVGAFQDGRPVREVVLTFTPRKVQPPTPVRPVKIN